MSRVADFRAGVRAAAPVLVGILPFALVAGLSAVEVGLSPVQAVGLSLVVFAGASQLAAIELLGKDAPLAVVVLTAVVVNVRHVMYSASIAPYFRDLALRTRAALAYLLTDQAYAFSVDEYARSPGRARVPYYLGVALTLWLVWQLGTVTGVVVGQGIPDEWGLSFALPLVFIALLVPALEDRPTVAAAVTAGVVVLLADFPLELGLVVAAIAGVVAGALVEEVDA